MTFALTQPIRFNRGWAEIFWMPRAGTFTTLDPASRDRLSDWVNANDRIDAVLDISARRWEVDGLRVIMGVFEKGKQRASWLIVGHDAVWTLARCDDGSVLPVCTTLAEILSLIDNAPGD